MFNYDTGHSYHYDSGQKYYEKHLTFSKSTATMTVENNFDGGAGSGNWGHAGRPGKRGGSSGGGGSSNRTGTKESGYSSKAQERKFRKKNGVSAGFDHLVTKSWTTKETKIAGMSVKQSNCLFGFYNGSGNTRDYLDADVYETPDGKRFVFQKGMSKQDQGMTPEKAIELYQKVPKEIRARGQDTVAFVGYENKDDPYWRQKYKDFTYSYATGGNDEITFYKCGTHDEDYFVTTYCHEIGHKMDMDIGSQNGTSKICESKEWKDAMAADEKKSGKKSPTEYGENSNGEDFAESIAGYARNILDFGYDFPNRTKLIEKYLNGGN